MTMDGMNANESLDLLLKGGHVIDPANDIDGKMDVGIKGNDIAQVAPDIPTANATTEQRPLGSWVVLKPRHNCIDHCFRRYAGEAILLLAPAGTLAMQRTRSAELVYLDDAIKQSTRCKT